MKIDQENIMSLAVDEAAPDESQSMLDNEIAEVDNLNLDFELE